MSSGAPGAVQLENPSGIVSPGGTSAANPSAIDVRQWAGGVVSALADDSVDRAWGASVPRIWVEQAVVRTDTGRWEGVRTITKVFQAGNIVAAGNSALWTPAAGKKFRLMAYRYGLTSNAAMAVAGLQSLELRDGNTFMNHLVQVQVPAAAGAGTTPLYDSGWVILPQNGILSSAANNVLNAWLLTALTAGAAYYIAAGTEE